jgi:hypothetical protein
MNERRNLIKLEIKFSLKEKVFKLKKKLNYLIK